MTEDFIMTLIANFPNFVGLIILVVILYRQNDRQTSYLEKILDECLDNDDNTKT